MKPERVAEIEQALREAGVPQEVVSYATKVGLHWGLRAANYLLFLTIMLAGFAVGGFYLWPALENITHRNARLHAEEIGALIYDYNFGISFVILVFSWILTSGVLTGLVTVLSRRLTANSFVSSISEGKKSRLVKWLVRSGIERLRAETDPAQYVRKMLLGWVLVMAVPAVPLAAIGAVAVTRDIQAYSLFTQTAYARSPFFPWGSRVPHEWSSAVSVETGCNHVERKGEISDDIIYQVTFADGASVRIGGAIPVEGTWLSAAEAIDLKLRASGATFSEWEWLGRDPMHPLCIAALRQRFSGRDFVRLKRLLRVAE